MRGLHGTLEIEGGEGGGKCSGGTVRTPEAVLTSRCCNLGRERTKGAAPGIIKRLREAGSHIVPLRALSVGDTGD